MSPLAAPGRKVVLLLAIAMVFGLSFAAPAGAQDPGAADLGVPADAPAPAAGKITRVLTFGVLETGCPGGAPAPCFDVTTLVANVGDVVVLHGNFLNSDIPHNVHVSEGAEGAPKSAVAPSAIHTVSFTMPASGEATFVCDLHASMSATVLTPEAAAAAGGHESVPTLGVHFLAYWVGVIAFAILFVVYGLTFFLFKYNETRAATDHWDRSESPGESKRLAAVAPLLAVVIAVVAIGGIIFIATR